LTAWLPPRNPAAMRALLSEASGGPETLILRDIAEPMPGKGEVRIRVAACGINYPDVLVIEDGYQFKPPRPFAPGSEVAGTIDALGEGVPGLAIGQRVIALLSHGGLAEAVVAPAARVTAMPDAMPMHVAAGFLLTYATSYHALKDVTRLAADETLLVLGAGGGVGLAAVELGKAAGARVIAAVSSETKAGAARAHGADEVAIYPREPDRRALGAQFKAACGPGGADVVYDPVGGVYTEAALRALGWGGRLLVVGFPAGISAPPLNLTLLKEASIHGVFWGAWSERFPVAHQANVAELFALWEAGKLRPEIGATLPLGQGGEAIARLARREAVGKIVVTMG